MMGKESLRQVWHGGPQRPRNIYTFKVNSSEDKLLKEKNEIQKDEIQVRGIQSCK